MEVHDDHLRLRALEDGIRGEEGVIRVRVKREAAQQVYDQQRTEGGLEAGIAPARTLGRIVCGTQDLRALVQVGLELPAGPGVVAERDDVGPGVEDQVGLAREDADAVGVFAVVTPILAFSVKAPAISMLAVFVSSVDFPR